jgi:threonine dehydrogenase-like Zn-dependent dehydrogenase
VAEHALIQTEYEAAAERNRKRHVRRLALVGAGAAGLCALFCLMAFLITVIALAVSAIG